MQIIARCPYCGSCWLLASSAADRRITCRKCQNLFKVPRLQDLPRALSLITEAKTAIYVDQAGEAYG